MTHMSVSFGHDFSSAQFPMVASVTTLKKGPVLVGRYEPTCPISRGIAIVVPRRINGKLIEYFAEDNRSTLFRCLISQSVIGHDGFVGG